MNTLKLLADITQLTYNGPKPGAGSVLTNVFQIAFGLLGGISLLVLAIAGLKFTLSRGNPDAIGKLRSTIIYASVGLAVALGASAIIQFVIKNL